MINCYVLRIFAGGLPALLQIFATFRSAHFSLKV
jgi:hypothetical protein